MLASAARAPVTAAALALVPASVLAERNVIITDLRGRSLGAMTAALEGVGASVQVVTDLAGARRSAALHGPNTVVIIDAPAKIESLWDAVRALSRQDAVVVVSPTATRWERVALLRSGADHVLNAPDPEELVAALVAVLRRAGPPGMAAPESLRCGPISIHLATRTGTCAERVLTLTALEFDLLAYFMSHAGEALSRQRLLADVWGYDIGGLDTVTVHLRRLRKKIEQDPSRPVLLQTVWGIGYRLVPGTESSSRTLGVLG